MQIPVTPLIGANSMDSSPGWVPTVGGFIAFPFSMWRADTEYLIDIPVSNFHRGKLQINYQPALTTTGMAADPTNTRYNTIINIEEGSRYQFCIPYMQNNPMAQVRPKTTSATIQTYD